MKTLILSLFLSTLIVQSSHAQQPPGPPTETIATAATHTPEQQEIIRLSQLKWDWMAEKKVDSLQTLFDDKAMFTHMGGTWGKSQELSTIKSGGIWYKKAAVYSVDVRMFGNTAVLLSDMDLVAVVGGNEVTNAFMVTEVYVKDNGKWKLAQLTFSHLLRPVKMDINKK
ncbi:MAG: nuclear transport factor 2 family protein [Acidobacteriota bacterium]|nr:nuclear transport factor 2 family protein [Acidobacteriota bacterium]